jgi:DMSO/TMAO reductase YedYZ molybdopterin-dependent catalytic subunit
LDVLAPRRATSAPLHVPVNKTVDEAGVREAATSSSWRLTVIGPKTFDLDLAAVEALDHVQHHLPLACVEGWSVSAHWQGPLLIDLVRRVGGNEDSRILVTSLEQGGSYRTSYVDGPQVGSAILATHLNGRRLTLDHGYPLRLIAPNRAGVLNTKWLTEIRVL